VLAVSFGDHPGDQESLCIGRIHESSSHFVKTRSTRHSPPSGDPPRCRWPEARQQSLANFPTRPGLEQGPILRGRESYSMQRYSERLPAEAPLRERLSIADKSIFAVTTISAAVELPPFARTYRRPPIYFRIPTRDCNEGSISFPKVFLDLFNMASSSMPHTKDKILSLPPTRRKYVKRFPREPSLEVYVRLMYTISK
jgi:hypothetical protein